MRHLLIGILLFLIWASLSTWHFSCNLYPLTQTVEETAQPEIISADTVAISHTETPSLPDLPGNITLYFDFDKTVILPSSFLEPFMASCLEYMTVDTTACLVLTGHTCSIGTDAYNKDLGMRRANAVYAYFLDHGCQSECVKTSSKGESEPAADNATKEGRMKNRRVEAQILTQ